MVACLRAFGGLLWLTLVWSTCGSLRQRSCELLRWCGYCVSGHAARSLCSTRIVGNASWSPSTVHDEYWHAHVDKNNTDHYGVCVWTRVIAGSTCADSVVTLPPADYSGLVYLSTAHKDFEGGYFQFIDSVSNHTIHPRAGRLLMFSSGMENLHEVMPVTSGERFVMSMWFTCDKRYQFHDFLNGKLDAVNALQW